MFRIGSLAMLVIVGACATDGKDGDPGAQGDPGAMGDPGAAGPAGPAGPQFAIPGVYTLANANGGNQVSAFVRASNGNLSRKGRFATGGNGLGAGLGSQGALVFDARLQRFFAVNPGDDSISMLAIDADGNLAAVSTVPSGGKRPISIAVHGSTVYVVNQGNLGAADVDANISGFTVSGNNLVAIANSTQALSGTGDVHPTDITFSPDGKYVVVVERFASKLDTFKLDASGAAGAGNFQASAGTQPFGFEWSPEGFLLVTEVGTGTATSSSVSSYALSPEGALNVITSKLPTLQGAACWIVSAGGFAYIANAATANITGVAVSETGALALHEPSGVTATTGGGAIDLAITPDRGYLYSLSSADHAVHVYSIGSDGSLVALPTLLGAPASAVGLVAR